MLSNYPIPSLVFVLIVIAFIFFSKSRRSSHASSRRNPAGAAATPISRLRPISELDQKDPAFSEESMREKISNLYVQMQNAWQNKDIECVRPYFSDALFTQMDRQLDAFRRNHRTNYVERIAVLDITLRGWYEEDQQDYLVANLKTRIVDYTVDDKTGKVISGNKNRELFMEYEWILSRAADVKTGDFDGMRTVNCPNCGAPLSINETAQCPYCDSVVTLEQHDWVITAIKGLSQRSA